MKPYLYEWTEEPNLEDLAVAMEKRLASILEGMAEMERMERERKSNPWERRKKISRLASFVFEKSQNQSLG